MKALLRPGVPRREVWAWAMFDFANSGYTTVVITAVFSAYFVSVVAGNAPWATFAWTLALSASYALVMLTAPLIGAYADAHASKKKIAVADHTGLCGRHGIAVLCGAGRVDPGNRRTGGFQLFLWYRRKPHRRILA